MFEMSAQGKIDSMYVPNDGVRHEIDINRFIKKTIVEKYDFKTRKDENKSPFRSYINRASSPGDISDVSLPSEKLNRSTLGDKKDNEKTYLTSISNTFTDDRGRKIMQRFFFAICGDQYAVELEASVNILPRNLNDKKK